jgi:23S rRNA pseudouridine1911/1915/1917 synthase
MKSCVKESLNVLYCDNHLLVVAKPAGLLSQPSPHESDSLETLAKEWIKKKKHKKGNVFLHAVHRLDKVVSGLVLFALTSKALSRLNQEMRAKRIKKIYFARVEGRINKDKGVLKAKLCHSSYRARASLQGKEAVLSYKVLKREKHTTIVKIFLHTGRYHQIRAQFSQLGHPICGDRKYGSMLSAFSANGIDLHHGIMSFTHPVSKKLMTFTLKPSFLAYNECVMIS